MIWATSKGWPGATVLVAATVGTIGCYGLDNGLALTPIMGWNTWDHFRCSGGSSDPGLGHACNAVRTRCIIAAVASRGILAVTMHYTHSTD
jgi:hypothetical protein